jgi:hypothetical protein
VKNQRKLSYEVKFDLRSEIGLRAGQKCFRRRNDHVQRKPQTRRKFSLLGKLGEHQWVRA